MYSFLEGMSFLDPNGVITGKPEHFYYKFGKNGRKSYYKRRPTEDNPNKVVVVPKHKIDPNILNDIKQYNEQEDILDLTAKIASLQLERNQLTKQLNFGVPNDCDYYYKIDVQGRKIYFKKNYRKKFDRISVKSIKPELIPKIPFYGCNADENTIKNKLEEIDRQIEEISSAIDKNEGDYETETQKMKERYESRKEEYRREREEFFEGLNFEKFDKNPKSDQLKVLLQYGIIDSIDNYTEETSKKRYKSWLLQNHPDRNGDSETCAKVISAFQSIFP